MTPLFQLIFHKYPGLNDLVLVEVPPLDPSEFFKYPAEGLGLEWNHPRKVTGGHVVEGGRYAQASAKLALHIASSGSAGVDGAAGVAVDKIAKKATALWQEREDSGSGYRAPINGNALEHALMLQSFLRDGAYQIEVPIGVRVPYQVKGLRNEAAIERRDRDAQTMALHKLEAEGEILAKDALWDWRTQVILAARWHNAEALTGLATKIDLGLLHVEDEDKSLHTLRQAHDDAVSALTDAEYAVRSAWREYSAAYKKMALKHLVQTAEGDPDILQQNIDRLVRVNEPIRIL